MKYIKAMRLFQTQPKWAALNRGDETEKNEVRKSYVLARTQGFAEESELSEHSVKPK